MNADVCQNYLVGNCHFGNECFHAHVRPAPQLAGVQKFLGVTALVQRAWSNRPDDALLTWRLLRMLLQSKRLKQSLDLVMYDSEISWVTNYQPQAHYTSVDLIQNAAVTPSERYAPDCFFSSLAQTIGKIGGHAQRRGAPAAHLVLMFTYTGAVGDYESEQVCTRLASLMRVTNLRAVIVGVGLQAEEKRSLARLCENNELFTLLECTSIKTSRRELAQLAVRLHAEIVIDAHSRHGLSVTDVKVPAEPVVSSAEHTSPRAPILLTA